MSKVLSVYYSLRAKISLSTTSKLKWMILKFCNDANDTVDRICEDAGI